MTSHLTTAQEQDSSDIEGESDVAVRSNATKSTLQLLALLCLAGTTLVAIARTPRTSLRHGPAQGEDSILQEFASWQDWGSPSAKTKPFKSLAQALEMERQAWEMTRQETCSWEAGDQVPQTPISWHGLSEKQETRCRALAGNGSPSQRSGKSRPSWCWRTLKHLACPSDASASPISWGSARSALLEEMGMYLDERFHPLDDASLCDDSSLGFPKSWTAYEVQRSIDWFSKNVQVFVLEMPRTTSRLTAASLVDMGIDFVSIACHDFLQLGVLQAAIANGSLPSSFATLQMSPQVAEKIGRATGHFHIQELASSPGHRKPIALVLEEGGLPSSDLQAKVWSLIREEAPCDWDVISLSSTCPVGRCVAPHLVRVGPDGDVHCSSLVNRGFKGVLYRTGVIAGFQGHWKRVAFDLNQLDCLDIDTALSTMADEVAFYSVPAVQTPGFFASKSEEQLQS